MLVLWMIFEGEAPSICDMCAKIKEEARSWVTTGAKGLRDILPTTCDVH
jgi:hypothetical protein